MGKLHAAFTTTQHYRYTSGQARAMPVNVEMRAPVDTKGDVTASRLKHHSETETFK